LARRKHETADALEEIASLGDRLAEWVARHAALTIAIAASILVGAAATGGYLSYSGHQADAASAALAALRAEFVTAMGGTPGFVEIPEPANPETARSLRLEFAEAYLSAATEHAGTPSATLARLEAGDLLTRAGESGRALEVWSEALEQAKRPALRGVLLTRIGGSHESAEAFTEAAQAHERAAEIEAFPLRSLALARAAWCWVKAGQRDRALSLYRRLRSIAPDFELPPHLDAPLRELEVSQGG
jgi:tetratricopeptide (TPR) repeat protein